MMTRFFCLVLLAFLSVIPLSYAQSSSEDDDIPPARTLPELIEETTQLDDDDALDTLDDLPDLRKEALREAAISYGARGGLAKRTEEIRESLEERANALNTIYDFKRLLIPAPSGFLMEPPIISEGEDATLVESGGQTAAATDRYIVINRNARIVTTPRSWRAYLEREWGEIKPPPSVLLPRTDEEKVEWVKYLTEGWKEGIRQADEIFQADLNKLLADYTGMIRYRKMLAQGIVSPPYALQIDRGVTGGGNEVRVGDRAVQITGPSVLRTEAFEWQPVSR